MERIELPYKYRPRTYQEPVWRHFEGPAEGKRGVCVWHRRAGKDATAINICAVKSQERVGQYWHILPFYRQGRNIVWNGKTREGRPFLDFFPSQLVERRIDNEMRLHLKNGSIYQVVGSDDIDALVGANPVGCVFSEYSLQDPRVWQMVEPILVENGGWALFIYTPRGHNHGYKLFKMASQNPKWFCELLGAGDNGTKRDDGKPVMSDAQIQEVREQGTPEEIIQQEYYGSFEAPIVGSYYANEMARAQKDGRFCNLPYDPKLPVDTSWDIGVGDSTVIIFSQNYGMEKRAIDFYENSGEGLAHYIRVMREKPYVYGNHYAPWDIDVREWTSGKSRLEVARGLGIKFRVTPQHSVEDGIEQCRNILPFCIFDAKKCERLIDALKEYRKEQDIKHSADGKPFYKDYPLHNWASHAADAFRIFCWNQKKTSRFDKKDAPPAVALDEFSYV